MPRRKARGHDCHIVLFHHTGLGTQSYSFFAGTFKNTRKFKISLSHFTIYAFAFVEIWLFRYISFVCVPCAQMHSIYQRNKTFLHGMSQQAAVLSQHFQIPAHCVGDNSNHFWRAFHQYFSITYFKIEKKKQITFAFDNNRDSKDTFNRQESMTGCVPLGWSLYNLAMSNYLVFNFLFLIL